MRKIFVVAFALAVLAVCGQAWADVGITAENFPDDTFRYYISSHFDTDSDGILSDSEIALVTSIPSGMIHYDQTIASFWIANITIPRFNPSQPSKPPHA